MKTKLFVIAIAAAALVGAFLAFRPDRAFTNVVVNEAAPVASTSNSMEEPMPISKGTFSNVAKHTEGNAEIWDVDGKQLLRLSDFETSNGPDVRVLVIDAEGKSVDLGNIKGNRGDQNYELPSGFDVNQVQIWCKRFNVTFGEASLA